MNLAEFKAKAVALLEAIESTIQHDVAHANARAVEFYEHVHDELRRTFDSHPSVVAARAPAIEAAPVDDGHAARVAADAAAAEQQRLEEQAMAQAAADAKAAAEKKAANAEMLENYAAILRDPNADPAEKRLAADRILVDPAATPEQLELANPSNKPESAPATATESTNQTASLADSGSQAGADAQQEQTTNETPSA